jgi:putative SOS response-associated peptidase YedK
MRKPLAFAGVWDTCKGNGETINSCAIITNEANGLVKPVHDRMPVIIYEECYADWLDRGERDTREMSKLLVPSQAGLMACHPVSKRVNSVGNDDKLCPAPVNLSLLD